jgi:release factor glutamine methyltransferase
MPRSWSPRRSAYRALRSRRILLAPAEAARLEALAARRAAGEPLAYLTGRREFWSLELEVTRDVLVPRPETELLVEWCLEAIAARRRPAVLDLGTGSGAIALAIARERPDAQVTAVDSSTAALALAARNAARHGLANLHFLTGNWFGPVDGLEFDAIVSNPPYVAPGDPALAALSHEPRAALVAGDDGLADLAVICAGAVARLAGDGCLIVEHGALQGAAVRELMAQSGLAGAATRRDLAGRERATRGNRPR